MSEPASPTAVSGPLEIRRARSEDIPRLAELACQLGYPSSSGEVALRFEAVQKSREHAVFVAETSRREIAGWICAFIYRTLESDTRAEISGLVVDENHRSRRVGERLLEKAEEWARENGCRSTGLRSNVIRTRAHAFYERNGYEHYKTQKSFRKPI